MRFGPASPDRWADVRHFIMPAIERVRETTEDDVIADLAANMAQLWIAEDAQPHCAVVTCLISTEKGPVCEIWLMGGRRRELWLHFLEVIEGAARERGCIRMKLTGRQGWKRLLPSYEQTAVVLEKVL